MDFLYSRHRLNVATSRARCIAVVVADTAGIVRALQRITEQTLYPFKQHLRFELEAFRAQIARSSPIFAGNFGGTIFR